MSGGQRVGGIIQLQTNGVLQNAKGEFSYNLGRPKRKAVVGADKVHGFTEEPQAGFIEGEITDRSDLDLDALVKLEDATVTLQLANGKVIMLRHAYYAGDGTGHTGEGNVDVRFEGDAEEVA
jgi:hypothetical protein